MILLHGITSDNGYTINPDNIVDLEVDKSGGTRITTSNMRIVYVVKESISDIKQAIFDYRTDVIREALFVDINTIRDILNMINANMPMNVK